MQTCPVLWKLSQMGKHRAKQNNNKKIQRKLVDVGFCGDFSVYTLVSPNMFSILHYHMYIYYFFFFLDEICVELYYFKCKID